MALWFYYGFTGMSAPFRLISLFFRGGKSHIITLQRPSAATHTRTHTHTPHTHTHTTHTHNHTHTQPYTHTHTLQLLHLVGSGTSLSLTSTKYNLAALLDERLWMWYKLAGGTVKESPCAHRGVVSALTSACGGARQVRVCIHLRQLVSGLVDLHFQRIHSRLGHVEHLKAW